MGVRAPGAGEHVGEHAEEWSIGYGYGGTQDSMTEPAWLTLNHPGECNLLETGYRLAVDEVGYHRISRPLVDYQHYLSDPDVNSLLDDILDDRTVDYWQQWLGYDSRCWTHAGSGAGAGDDGNIDVHGDDASGAPLRSPLMRLVVARCSVGYPGRLSSHLPSAIRLLMIKADGCVAIHVDGGAYKPLNWMNAPNHLVETDNEWVVTNAKGEMLEIAIEEVLVDLSHDLGEDPGLSKDGVEKIPQELLAERAGAIENGLETLEREYMTNLGPVDLLCKDQDGQVVAVEIKRRGEISGIEQLSRYLESLNKDSVLAPVRGILAAQSITPQAKTLAADRGIGCVEVDYDALRGIEGMAPRLFEV